MVTESSAGKWDRWYGLDGVGDAPMPYGLTPTYALGAEWLAPCALIEDWGCGKGWLRTLVHPDRYRGIDGSRSPFADEVRDLAEYQSQVPGVFMRHVLEHDFRWADILANAVASFTERMVLILFTPLADRTYDLRWEEDPGVPNLAFALSDLTPLFGDVHWTIETLATDSLFGTETVFRLKRP